MAKKKQQKKNLINLIKQKVSVYLERRPHRSFRLTRRRDYVRSLNIPGYFSFTKEVVVTLWQRRKIFLSLALFYAVLTVLLIGISSQETYKTLNDTLNNSSGDLFSGGVGEIGKAGLLFLTALTGGLSPQISESQQIYAYLVTLLTWLTTVWLLRNLLAGHKVKLRDALYNAGAPIVSTFLVSLLLIIQLIPVSLAIIGYSAASLTGILNVGIEAMMFWISAILLVVLSLYWITSTFFALIIVTLPGMYPWKAIRTAGDLVIGHRIKVLLRLVWLAFITIIVWAIIIIPSILIDKWIKGLWPAINWLPIIPIELLILSALTIVWVSSYIYLLYRKVVDDGTV